MSVDVDVRGAKELQAELEKAFGPNMKKTLQKATTSGARFLKPPTQAAAPRGRTGRLRRSISARQARRQRPAAVVTARPRIAFYRHMVIGGTKAHRIRFPDQRAAEVPKTQGNIRHPGAKANPFIERVGDRYGGAAVEVAQRVIEQEIP
jgi:hypothetical protein